MFFSKPQKLQNSKFKQPRPIVFNTKYQKQDNSATTKFCNSTNKGIQY